MKLAILNSLFLFLSFAFAELQPRKPKINHPEFDKALSTRILIGLPEYIYFADKVDEFPFSFGKNVSGTPSWMAIKPPNLLYVVDESSKYLKLYEIDFDNSTASLKSEQEGSSGVVHLQFDKNYTRLVGSAYGEGTVDVWNTTNAGLELMKTIPSQVEPGSKKDSQNKAHPHQANLDPTGRFFVINDLGLDSIMVIDSKDDKFKVVGTQTAPRGCGPRHGTFYPQQGDKATHYIVVCESSNKVLVYTVTYGKDYLDLDQARSTSTFGPGLPPANATTAAAGAIVLASNNRDLYISNRLTGNSTDFISHFHISSPKSTSLSLEFISCASTHGISPRTISLSTDDRYLLIANQGVGDNGLVALDRQANGILSSVPFAVQGGRNLNPQFVQQIP
ncbi:hypothetical protein SNK03_013392 [Fusarium graminearum]